MTSDSQKDYDNYVYLQTVKYMSHESEHSVWAEGQIKFLDSVIDHFPVAAKVLDAGCGDGVSLIELAKLGFSAVGVDLNENKLDIGRGKNCIVHGGDVHDLSFFSDQEFDVILCSHVLEHCFDPVKVLNGFWRILKRNGLLFIVVPFPDTADYAIDAHVGRDILGTSNPHEGKDQLVSLIEDNNFSVFKAHTDSFREPEVWVFCRKIDGAA